MIAFECKGLFVNFTGAEAVVTRRDGPETMTTDEAFEIIQAEIEKGFDRATVDLEDTILVFPSPGVVVAFDKLTGICHRGTFTTEEMIAVLELAFLGDDCPRAVSAYRIAEAAIKGWPNEVRPIP